MQQLYISRSSVCVCVCLNDHMDTLGKVLGEKNSFYGVKLNILSFLQLPHAQTSLFIEQQAHFTLYSLEIKP